MGSVQRSAPVALLFVVMGLFIATNVAAAVRVCVVVETDAKEEEGIKKLVLSEIARHPSHQVVDESCETHLTVEVFRVDKRRFLTARIENEVPVRYALDSDHPIDQMLKQALALVLGNDPVYLTKDISKLSLMQRASHSVLKKGHNLLRVELFEMLSRGDGEPAFTTGGAFSVTRGADHFRILARILVAGRPGEPKAGTSFLRIAAGFDIGFTYELSALSNSTFYVSGGFGVQYHRYEGWLDAGGEQERDHINAVLPAPFLRIGGRFLRVHDFDIDLFLAGYIPLMKVNDEDAPIFGDDGLYTPAVQVGMGVGF